MFKKLDIKGFNNWKCDTKQRIIRGIEISQRGNVRENSNSYKLDLNNVIVLGVHMDREMIRNRITERLEFRLKDGMIDEVRELLSNNILTLPRLDYFGLEYKYIGYYLANKLSYDEMFNKLNTAIHKFAKKQMTFFRRMEKRGVKINWIHHGNFEEAMNIINSV